MFKINFSKYIKKNYSKLCPNSLNNKKQKKGNQFQYIFLLDKFNVIYFCVYCVYLSIISQYFILRVMLTMWFNPESKLRKKIQNTKFANVNPIKYFLLTKFHFLILINLVLFFLAENFKFGSRKI